jgi:hypothetical protein
VLGFLGLTLIGGGILITDSAIRSWRAAVAADLPLWTVYLLDITLVALFAWACWHMVAIARTEITTEGITAPRFMRKPPTILWKDVVKITGTPQMCTIHSSSAAILLSSAVLGGAELLPALKQHAPTSAFESA